MTQPEFFAYTQLHPTQVNVWYSDGPAPYQIKAVTLPVYDQGTPPQDVSQYLTQIQQISIPLSTGEVITLEIITRQSVSTTLGNYYYFTVVPYTISNIGNSSLTNTDVVFTPAIDGNIFNDSPYNVLQGFIESERTSAYIMQSDRYKIGTLENPTYTGPLNIDELLSGSAALAQVQDSNYSDTGWISARYDGTKTTRLEYKSAEPALTGRFFEAAEYPSGSSIAQINYQISSSQVTYTNHFYAGTGDVPGFTVLNTGLYYSQSYSQYDELIFVQPVGYGAAPIVPKAGDFIDTNTATHSEIAKVIAVGIITSPSLKYSLQLERGYYGTPQAFTGTGTAMNKLIPVQVYNVSGNRLTGVPKGKVLVKETGAILTLDKLGYVVSST